MGTRSPGVFNLLFNEEWRLETVGIDSSESNSPSKPSAGDVLLLAGALGIIAYGISEAKKDGCSVTEIVISSLVPYSNSDWCRDR